jgi:hypothetical protein
MDMIAKLGKDTGMCEEDLILFQGHCFNRLCNTWFEAIKNYLSRKLTDYLRPDLELILAHLCVSCKISDLLCQVDKKYTVLPPITSREVVTIMPIGRSAFVPARDICHLSMF